MSVKEHVLKPAIGYRWVLPINDWQSIPVGHLLQKAETAIINERLQYCFGQHLLKVGALSCELKTPQSLINHQINLTSDYNSSSKAGIISEFDEMAFQSNSIDAAVVSHVIEFCADPHQVLRELHRVLIPNGNMIISVFNPLSFLATNKLWFGSQFQQFRQGRFFTLSRIKDWMSLLGFEVIDEQSLFYSRLGQSGEQLDTGTWPKLIKTVMPWAAGVTVLTVKKREWPLTPVRPRLRYKTVFNPSVSRPTVNTKNTS